MKWWPAPVPSPGGFLVNIGLIMEVWSGGQYRATLHRVIFPKPAEEEAAEELVDRYTIAYFVQPDGDVVSHSLQGRMTKMTPAVPPAYPFWWED